MTERREHNPTESDINFSSEKTINITDIERLVAYGQDVYPMVITDSYGPEVINPEVDELQKALSGDYEDWINGGKTALVPMQANGRCIANCKGCVFSAKVTNDELKLNGSVNISDFIARPVTVEAMSVIIANAYEEIGEPFRLGAVMSGDPAFNPHSLDVIKQTIDDPRVKASRWSTIGVDTKVDVLDVFVQAAEYWANSPSEHKPHFQVSLHSTDPIQRAEYVNYHAGSSYLKPLPMENIASAFAKIKEKTGKPSTLAFIVDNEDVPIDVAVLREHFDPEYTWISLRPRIPTLKYDVDPDNEKLIQIYSELRENGWSVMVVPPTSSGSEQRNLAIGRA